MPHSKGHLNPGTVGVTFDRFDLGAETVDVVRHVWIARWGLEAGHTSAQRVLGYPTSNIVFDQGGAFLAGPDPRLVVKTLADSGWTVGVLLRPAATRLMTATAPTDLIGKTEAIPMAPFAELAAAMATANERNVLASILRSWLAPLAGQIDDRSRLVNNVCRVAEENENILRSAALAVHAGMSERSLERLLREYVGISPKWLIDCRRLQTAATKLFSDPGIDLTSLALSLGYADYAHFSRKYKTILGTTPGTDRHSILANREAAFAKPQVVHKLHPTTRV